MTDSRSGLGLLLDASGVLALETTAGTRRTRFPAYRLASDVNPAVLDDLTHFAARAALARCSKPLGAVLVETHATTRTWTFEDGLVVHERRRPMHPVGALALPGVSPGSRTVPDLEPRTRRAIDTVRSAFRGTTAR